LFLRLIFDYLCSCFIFSQKRPWSLTLYGSTDQNDESLRKWKESLGIGSGTTIGDASDPRKVIIVSLGLEVRMKFMGNAILNNLIDFGVVI
jgi:hypothetical protein